MAKRTRSHGVSAARKDNVVLARLMTAPQGRTTGELVERLTTEYLWASHEHVYASLRRLERRQLVVRTPTEAGLLWQAVAPDPDDPLERAFAQPPHIDADVLAAAAREPHGRRHAYTHEEIVAAICRWADLHDGDPPRQSDWNPAMLRMFAKRMARRAVAHLQRIAEYDAGQWPSEQTVRKYFGSWNAALAAAGYGHRLRSSGNQPRTSDLQLVPGVGAVDSLDKLMDRVFTSLHAGDNTTLRDTLLDLSIAAREWALAVGPARQPTDPGGEQPE